MIGLLDVFDEQAHVFLSHASLNNNVLQEPAWTGNGKRLFRSFPLLQHVTQNVRIKGAENEGNL